jgi:CTD small phosphatase-like protein 2
MVSALHDFSYDKSKNLKLPQIIKLASKTPKLQYNLTQGLVLPDISRMQTPSPRKISPILVHATEKSSSIDKQLINLEKIISQEKKLSSILDSLNTNDNTLDLCEDYWQLSNDEALWGIEKLFKEPRTRKAMRDSIIIESLGIALVIFCCSKVSDWTKINNQMKNMVYFLHQNFLTIIDLILSRLPLEASSSMWVLSLKDSIKSKKTKSAKRSEHPIHLKQHNEIISNCIRTVIRLLPIKSTPSLAMLSHILANRDKFSIPVARSYVFQEPSSPVISVSPPYLPAIHDKKLTLVLDLDETLVHYSIQGVTGQLLVRPWCEEFLKEMDSYYELVIFTAGLQEVRNR